MSTKIYSGFRFRESSWATAHKHIMGFRLELASVVHDHEATLLARRTTEIFDRRTLGLDDASDKGPYVAAYLEQMEDDQKNRPSFDLSLFPYGNKIYGIAFGFPQYEALWFEKPFVERWGYWNNTDRPEDVTGREWGVRRRTWDKILVGYASPAMSGFLAKCIAQYGDRVRIADVMKRLPTLGERVKAQAIPQIAEERDVQPNGYFAFAQWTRSEEGAKRLAEVSETIKPKLVRRITAKQLNPI